MNIDRKGISAVYIKNDEKLVQFIRFINVNSDNTFDELLKLSIIPHNPSILTMIANCENIHTSLTETL